jgi:hypothetical protein
MNRICIIIVILFFFFQCGEYPDTAYLLNRAPVIYPDYTEIIVPPNIAPLNFVVREKGSKYLVKLYSMTEDTIQIKSGNGKIGIPQKKWSDLLNANKGKSLYFDIFVRKEDGWVKYKTVKNHIALETTDSFLTYRLIEPQFSFWKILGIYQRNLETFEEKTVLKNSLTGSNCMNCHAYCKNDASKMLLHIRGGATSGTLIVQDGEVKKVNTGTAFSRAGAYPSWHPSGELIAFSSNNLTLFFHSCGEIRDVVDRKSDLIIYLIQENKITSDVSIAHPEYMETFPAWSPDGEYLYFCRTNSFESYLNETGSDLDYKNILYDLVRVKFDRLSMTWGKPEIMVDSKESGLSVIMPRVSPDGRFVMFCMAEYGSFPIYRPESDLYMLDLTTGNYRNLTEINSPRTDSFHSFSHESKWFIFSSKRENGLCSRPYLSYLSSEGIPSKPFVIPQKDPEFYKTFIKNYNRPELSWSAVEISPRELAETAYGETIQAELDAKLATGDAKESDTEDYYFIQQ